MRSRRIVVPDETSNADEVWVRNSRSVRFCLSRSRRNSESKIWFLGIYTASGVNPPVCFTKVSYLITKNGYSQLIIDRMFYSIPDFPRSLVKRFFPKLNVLAILQVCAD